MSFSKKLILKASLKSTKALKIDIFIYLQYKLKKALRIVDTYSVIKDDKLRVKSIKGGAFWHFKCAKKCSLYIRKNNELDLLYIKPSSLYILFFKIFYE